VKQKHYTGEVPDGFVLEEGDVLVAMTEQAEGLLGSSAWIPSSGKYLHNQRLGRVVELNEECLDKRYLYHLFNTRSVRHQISASASGTKVRHTAPERIGRVEVDLPPLASQRQIGEMLSAYDALIENNRRRMALLEEANGSSASASPATNTPALWMVCRKGGNACRWVSASR
jgi:type I restriction enzyme S subunit